MTDAIIPGQPLLHRGPPPTQPSTATLSPATSGVQDDLPTPAAHLLPLGVISADHYRPAEGANSIPGHMLSPGRYRAQDGPSRRGTGRGGVIKAVHQFGVMIAAAAQNPGGAPQSVLQPIPSPFLGGVMLCLIQIQLQYLTSVNGAGSANGCAEESD